LLGLSFAFAAIDYFQYAQELKVSWNYKILYIFYMWQQALGMLYPLSIIFALILTKISFVKSNTMGIFHAFGYTKRELVAPMFFFASLTYLLFVGLHTTEFSYARDKGSALLKNEIGAYNVNDIFFKYNDTFVYMKKLDPVHHVYNTKGSLVHYTIEHRKSISTLHGYKPKIIESLYEGKTLNIIDAYHTWKLLKSQHLNSDKIRSALYEKTVVPLFALAMLLILFFKIPFHARMMRMGFVVALSLGVTFVIWGILFGLNQIGENGVLELEPLGHTASCKAGCRCGLCEYWRGIPCVGCRCGQVQDHLFGCRQT